MKTPIFASLLALILLGAGCSMNSSTTPVVEPTPSPTDAPSNPQPTPTPSTSMPSSSTFSGILPADQVHKKRVSIKTNQGDMIVELDHTQGPRAASNFLTLANAGFYNGTIFHRVIPGFMIQGGDPTGTGMGGPGYQFENDPVTGLPEKSFNMQGQSFTAPYYAAGVLAMANAGPDTNGSQFFIMVEDYPLSPDYSIFGRVVEGLDVAQKISNLSRDGQDRPTQEVKMTSVSVQ